jgi:hypothetical protein
MNYNHGKLISSRSPTDSQANDRRYREFGPIVDSSKEIKHIAASIAPKLATESLITAIQTRVDLFIDDDSTPIQTPATLVLSRMTPASKVFNNHVVSCGAIATLVASVLRSYGRPVKLIHGTYRDCDHAWLALGDDVSREWILYDPMAGRSGSTFEQDYQTVAKCADWSEILPILIAADAKYSTIAA